MEKKQRGSEKLMTAWKNRTLTDAAVQEIAAELDKSPATVERVNVVGGEKASGVQMLLSYSGDDVPWCGNDLAYWMRWHRRFGGGVVTPPKIIINGIPWPDLVHVQLDFGQFIGPAVDLTRDIEGMRLDVKQLGR